MSLQEKVDKMEQDLKDLKKELGNQTTDVVVVLDRSGSMQSNKSDHEGGLRSFVEQQKGLENASKIRFTFIQFDDVNSCEIIYDRVRLNKVGELNLVPRGFTPLRDAIGKSIAHIESKATGDVLFLIVSDGEENSSKEWTNEALKNKIKQMEEKGWQFTFLGTNFDAVTTGGNLGFNVSKVANYGNNSAGINNSYHNISAKFSGFYRARGAGASVVDASSNLDFSEEDREFIQGE